TAEVFFDDVHVPCKNIIGQEGMGFTYQMLQFQEERLWAVANSELFSWQGEKLFRNEANQNAFPKMDDCTSVCLTTCSTCSAAD
ncbi:hypothetical protein GOODEAATRI_032273, partial [Goodea atripinnis]